MSKKKNLVIVLGPTAVGKSSTAIKLAQSFKGEVINCDSMQVYRGFDIGTDKLPPNERKNIPHHLLDIAEPTHQFTAAEFVRSALTSIKEIRKRDRLPIIAGGTGLYLKALLSGLFPEDNKDPKIRQYLQKKAEKYGLGCLWKELVEVDPQYSEKIGKNDRIRIIRALEVFHSTQRPLSEHFYYTKSYVKDFNIIKIGLKLEREKLYKLIETRVDKMYSNGIVEEAQNLLSKGIPEFAPPFKALGYKQVLDYFQSKISLNEAITQTKIETRHYAKRQMTWFKKMEGIKWFQSQDLSDIEKYIKANLI